MALEDELRHRHERLEQIRSLGYSPYGHAFEQSHTIAEILTAYSGKTAEELAERVRVRVAGRIQTMRRMGKAGFLHLPRDGEQLQIYVKKDARRRERLPALSSWWTSATSSAWRAICSARAPAS